MIREYCIAFVCLSEYETTCLLTTFKIKLRKQNSIAQQTTNYFTTFLIIFHARKL